MGSSRMLNRILNQGGQRLTAFQSSKLYQYHTHLTKKNKEYNLIGPADFYDVVRKHYLDSLLIFNILDKLQINLKEIVDVGSGGGLPGIPLAIARPEVHFVLIEKRKLRYQFLVETVKQMNLTNVQIFCENLSARQPLLHSQKIDLQEKKLFPAFIARAVTTMADFVQRCAPHLAPKGLVICMKGPNCSHELSECLERNNEFSLLHDYHYQLPLAIKKNDDLRRLIIWQMIKQ